MENASKALIIAGAILLSIAIIGIGMFVYQQAAGVMGNINMSEQEVAAYNAPFASYEGGQSGTTVRVLLDKIKQHNNTNSAEDPSRQILVSTSVGEEEAPITSSHAGSTPTDISTIKATILSGAKYTVTFTRDTVSGIIYEVHIVQIT